MYRCHGLQDVNKGPKQAAEQEILHLNSNKSVFVNQIVY